MTDTSPTHDIYVGYLEAPARHRTLVRILVPTLAFLMLGAAAAFAVSQRDPGRAVWSLDQQSWIGTVADEPFPALVTAEGELFLLVGIGKLGVHDRITPHVGTPVTVEGFLLQRDDRRIIELIDGDAAITPAPSDTPTTRISELPRSRPRFVSLTGEIVDGKCYLGAMKPGDGKAHKACAILCIQGGLPPMLAYVNHDDELAMALLVVDGSTVLAPSILNLVAEPVSVEGSVTSIGSLDIISTTPDLIRRLTN